MKKLLSFLNPMRLIRVLLKLVLATLVAIYYVINRSFLFLLLGYVSLYFFIGSTQFPALIEQVLSDEIPGMVTFANARWGPDPTEFRFAHVRIYSGKHQEVVHTPAVVAYLDIPGTVAGALESFALSDAPITVMIDRAIVSDGWTWVEVRDDGTVGILTAFDDLDEPPRDPNDPPPALNIHIKDVVLHNHHGWLDSPGFTIEWENLNVRGDLHIVDSPGTVNFDVSSATIGSTDVYFKPHMFPGTSPGRLHVPVRDLGITLLQWRGSKFTVARTGGSLDDGDIAFHGSVESKPAIRKLEGSIVAHIGERSALLRDLFGKDKPVMGALEVSVTGSTELSAWSDAEVAVQTDHLQVGDLSLADVDGTFAITPLLTADGTFDHRWDVRRLTAQALGGRVAVAKTSYTSVAGSNQVVRPGARRHVFNVTLALQQVNPWALLGSDLLDVKALTSEVQALPFLDGRLDGRLQVAGSLDQGTGLIAVETRTEGLTMSWEGGRRGLPLASRYKLTGSLQYMLAPALSLGNDTLETAEYLRFTEFGLVSGGDALGVHGIVDLAHETLDLAATARVGNLSRFIGKLSAGAGSSDAVGGRFRLIDARIGGSFEDPAVRGDVRITQAELGGRTIGTVSATVDLSHGTLALADVKSDTPYGKLKASGQIRLWRNSLKHPDPKLPFVISKLSVKALELGKLAPQLGFVGVFDVTQHRQIKGSAANPLESITGEVTVAAKNLSLVGESVRWMTTRIQATKDKFRLREGVFALCRHPRKRSKKGGAAAHCKRGGPMLKVSGELDKSWPAGRGPKFKAHVRTRNLPLDAIGAFRDLSDLQGEVTANVHIEGRPKAPRFFGSVKLRDFGIGSIDLGNAQLDLTWGRAGEIVVTAMQFFEGMNLLESRVDLNKGRLRARFDADIVDLPVFARLLPALGLNPTIDIIGTGRASFEVDLGGRIPWRLRFDAAPGDVTIAVHDGKVLYKNGDHIRYRMVPDLLRVLQPVRFTSGKGRDVVLCGGIQDDRWALEMAGEIGAELVKPLPLIRDLFGAFEGSLLVAPDKEVAGRSKRSGCLRQAGDNVMLLGGPLSRPTLDGTFIPHKMSFTPRNLGRSVAVKDGARIKVRPTRRLGRQLIRIEPGKFAFHGELDDGTFYVSGDLFLQDLSIDDADLAIGGSEIYWASAGEYNLTFNPDVSLVVEDFSNDPTRRITLGGDVLITDGNYFKSFDSFARALGTVTGGAGQGYSRPLTERVPWLKSLTMNLDVTSTHFSVRSAFPTGNIDLEARIDVNVSGSLDAPQVRRRVDILPEGTITYNLFRRNFEVRNGFLEFDGPPGRPRIGLRAETEVEYLERTASSSDRPAEERQVTVVILISGRLPDDLNIELSSQPGGFSQADLERLIVTGKPLRDTASARDDTVFSFDLGSFVNTLLKAPFVDAVKLGLTQEGFVDTQIVTKFGRDVRLRTRAVQEAGDSTRLSARFEFRLTDNVVLEGRADRSTGTDFANSNERYEARIKYRIPLD